MSEGDAAFNVHHWFTAKWPLFS